MNVTPDTRKKVEEKLAAFIDAGRELNDAWREAMDEDADAAFDLIAEYPSWMPSFDEAVADIAMMEVKTSVLRRISCVHIWSKVLPANPGAWPSFQEPADVLELLPDKVRIFNPNTMDEPMLIPYGDLHAYREVRVA